MNADNELAWVFEILKRAMLARRCGLKEEAISLCNIANNRYKTLLKHPSTEVQMRVVYSNAGTQISNIQTIVSDNSFWAMQINAPEFQSIESELSLFFLDNDTNIDTNNL